MTQCQITVDDGVILTHINTQTPVYYRQQGIVSNTFISRVDPLCDQQAAGLWLSSIRVSDGELVRREAKWVIVHLAALRPVSAKPTEHGLLLGAVDWRRSWRRPESVSTGNIRKHS